MSSGSEEPLETIAIVGLACRFPGAPDAARFWSNLAQGIESISFFTKEELLLAGVAPALLDDPRYVRSGGGRLSGIDLFDADFFGFDAEEAALLDPQHRLFLECAHEALENAGHDPARATGPIGIFAGSGGPHYLLRHVARNARVRSDAGALAVSIGNEKDFVPLRVAYLLDLRGPGIGVQTACTTSLVAVHLACQSLLAGECDLALAGATSIAALRKEGYLYDADGPYSADGRCRAFDAEASGMVGGDGVGIVVLRRLSDALADGDHVRAVIRGSAVNNDGAGKVGFLAPGVDGQRRAVREALSIAGVDARSIGYVEAHGTGTPLGDMIEVAALTDAFRADTDARGYCGLGSVKPNIGHLNAAAGAAALIKAVLALEHRTLPPSLWFEEPNPEIDFAASPFRVITRAEPWRAEGAPRRACVHGTAIGGTNAHLVLEEAPPVPARAAHQGAQLLLLSAKTPAALERATAQLAEHLREHPEHALADVAFTLQVGRRAFPHRRALVASDAQQAAAWLAAGGAPVRSALQERADRQIGMVFPAACALPAGAGRALCGDPAFARALDECAELARELCDADLRAVVRGDAAAPAPGSREERLALVATQYALARLWTAHGVTPQIALGAGAGECTAACIAGALALADALRAAAGLPPRGEAAAPSIACLSAATGAVLTRAAAADPQHWKTALAGPARLDDALHALLGKPRIALHLGADDVAVRARALFPGVTALSGVPLPQDGALRAALLEVIAQLWLAGVAIDWPRLHAGEPRRRVPLPTYPFERRRYWIEADADAGDPAPATVVPAHAGARPPLASVFVAPETEIEARIARVWCATLGLDRVGIHDNFFEVGGRSLTGIRVMSQLREDLRVDLALRQLFEAPTIAELAKLVEVARWVDDGGGTSEQGSGEREELEL